MTLTEQWNKGKLPEGDYYIKRRNGYLPYDNIDSRGVWRNSIDEDIVEVLAPVPSYDEWQELSKQRNQLIRDVKDLAYIQEENQQLKELLKECRYNVATDLEDAIMCESNVDIEYFEYLLTRIDNAIGEKK